MKVYCDRERLWAAFQIASPVAPSRSPKTILQSVKLEASRQGAALLATDMEIGIRVEVQGVEVEQEGAALLPVDRVGAILRESQDAKLLIESSPSGTLLQGERSRFRLPAEDPDTFPNIALFEEEKYHELPARLLKELISRTAFATDTESTRYALGGVLLEMEGKQITAVGTDGRRLAKMEGPAEAIGGHSTKDRPTIVPTKATHLIERAVSGGDDTVCLAARGNDLLVKSPRATVYCRLIEGRFPRWRDVIPGGDGYQQIELLVQPVHSAVRQAAVVTSEESRGVDFQFKEGSLILAGQTAERGAAQIELPTSYSGPELAVVLNPHFVGDFLKVLDPEKTFTFHIRDSESAAMLTTDDGYAYVIMPLARDG